MDRIDYRILECLKKNARMTTSEIGKSINMSVSAVSERIKRLESSGVISQYTTILNRERVGQDVRAFIMVRIENPEFYSDSIEDMMRREPHILEAHMLAGDYDYMLKVVARSTRSLEQLLYAIKSTKGIQKTMTMMVLSSLKEEFTIMPDEDMIVK